MASKPDVLAVINATGASFDILAADLRRSLPEFNIRVKAHEQVDGEICDVLLCLWWKPLVKGLGQRVVAKRAVIGAVFDLHSWTISQHERRMMRQAIEAMDYLVAGSEQILAALREHYQLPPSWICESGVDCERFMPLPYPQQFTALWVGNSRAGEQDLKGVAIAKAAAESAGVRLTIADSIGVEGDAVPYAEMPRWYRQGTCLIIASRSEGTPRTLLEAAACGRLVCATRVGVVPRIVHHGVNGVIVERSVESVAAGLRYLRHLTTVVDPQLLKQCARGAALAFDLPSRIGQWRGVLSVAATGKWWREQRGGDEAEVASPAPASSQLEIQELQGRAAPPDDLQRMINETEVQQGISDQGRPRILITSTYRFACRTIHIIRPLVGKYRFCVAGGGDDSRPKAVWSLYPFNDARLGRYLSHRHGIPHVITMRGQFHHLARHIVSDALEVYRDCTAIVTLTRSLHTSLCELEPELRKKRWICIPNGVEPLEFTAADLDVPRPMIACPTNFNFEGKRQAADELVEAFRSFKGSVLFFGQEGKFRPPAGPMGGPCRYLGFRADRLAIMAAADLIVYHSHIDGQPTALMEAMSLGKPCVVGRHAGSGAHEFVVDGETGLVRGSAVSIAIAAAQVLADRGLRERLASGARRAAAEQWSWQRAAAQYDELFADMVRPR